jgi:hypothetical protein
MHASAPSLAAAIAAMEHYSAAKQSSLNQDQKATVHEILCRLQRLAAEVASLIDINNQLSDSDGLSTDFDASSDTLTVRGAEGMELSITLPRANPDVPIEMVQHAAAHSTRPDSNETAEVKDLRHRLETTLEAYYYNAHHILKLIQTLPGLKGFECREVTIVRNKLVEHAKSGSIYTFGYGSTGPLVKAFQRGEHREWNDEGLVPNTVKFARAIESTIQRALPAT